MGLIFKYLKKSLFISIFFIFCFNIFPSVSAYYVNVDITVDESGYVDIEGVTNHPDLIVSDSEQYTSKKKSVWLLNITLDDYFSDFVFTLYLPKGSSIIYVKSSASIRISEDSGRLIINGFGEDMDNFSLIVQYKIKRLTESPDGFFSAFLLFIIIFLVILFIYFYKFKNKNIKEKNKLNSDLSFKGLNDRQKNIINILIKSETGLTQTEIQKELGIPKASVSRNIRRLELKGLIEKEKIGMSNIIRIKKR